MFSGCTSLVTLPALPATQLVNRCYNHMFDGCTEIMLSATPDASTYPDAYQLPFSGTGDTACLSSWGTAMFLGTGGTFKDSPTINTTYYTSNTIVGP